MMKKRILALVLLLMSLLVATATGDSFKVQGNYFADSQSSDIMTGMLKYENEFKDYYKVNVKGVIDAITSASPKAQSSRLEDTYVGGFTNSGQRGFFSTVPNWDKLRAEVSGSGGFKYEETEGNIGAIYSHESLYKSASIWASLAQSFFLQNSVLEGTYFHNFDLVDTDLKDVEMKYGYPLPKGVDGVSLGWTQLFSKKTIAQFYLNGRFEQGALENPEREMILEQPDGEQVVDREDLPDTRNRYAASSRVAQYLWKNSSLHLGYRYYFDNWEIDAHTIETMWFQYLSPWALLRLRGRYHSQSESKYVMFEAVENQDDYFSANPVLQAFTSYLTGIQITLMTRSTLARRLKVSGGLGFDYYSQSSRQGVTDGYSALIGSGNLMFLF